MVHCFFNPQTKLLWISYTEFMSAHCSTQSDQCLEQQLLNNKITFIFPGNCQLLINGAVPLFFPTGNKTGFPAWARIAIVIDSFLKLWLFYWDDLVTHCYFNLLFLKHKSFQYSYVLLWSACYLEHLFRVSPKFHGINSYCWNLRIQCLF